MSVETSTQSLGIAICFLLVAYIFYFLGSSHATPVPIPQPYTTPNSPNCETEQRERSAAVPSAEYFQGFNDGRKAFQEFSRGDLIRDFKKESKNLARDLKEKMAEVEKQEEARQKWFKERQVAMKGWREEQLDSIWREKQAGERGLAGWFNFGGMRWVSKPVEEKVNRGKGVPAKERKQERVEGEWRDEKRGWVD